jgi:hypothetical protein
VFVEHETIVCISIDGDSDAMVRSIQNRVFGKALHGRLRPFVV